MKTLSKQSATEQDTFYVLGTLASIFDQYYRAQGNRVVSKHLPMFLAWMEDKDHLDSVASRISSFFERRYQILFPPNKIRAFREGQPLEVEVSDNQRSCGETRFLQQGASSMRIQQLKECFIASSYWRRILKDQGSLGRNLALNPAISFISGFDKDVRLTNLISRLDCVDSGWAKTAMAMGAYFYFVMIAEVLVLGNKSLQKLFLSTIKQMNWSLVSSIHQHITATSINIIQSTQNQFNEENKNLMAVIALIREARKASATLFQQNAITPEVNISISPALLEFYFMVGILTNGRFETADEDFTGGKSFTPRAAFMYSLGRVAYAASAIEGSTFKSRSFLRAIPLYRSSDPADWLVLINYCMRVLVRKIGTVSIELKASMLKSKGADSLDNSCKSLLNCEQWIHNSLGTAKPILESVIKGFLDLLKYGASAHHSYEASTAFMMGFSYEQYLSRKTSIGDEKK